MEKLFSLGYVFLRSRLKSVKEIHREYGENSWWPYITYGFITTDCTVMLSASGMTAYPAKLVSFEEFLDLRIHE